MSRDFNLYAPPLTWSSWTTVASYLGSIDFSIDTSANGSTQIYGRVRYYKGDGAGTQVDETFIGSTTIKTSNSVANVEVCLKGNPFGSAVRLTINP